MNKTLEIIVPIYNEAECFNELLVRLIKVREDIGDLAETSFIFVNDGSKDNSANLLKHSAKKYPFVKVLNFVKNFGHQMAITAGMDASTANYVAVIDADLQDPPELIKEMLICAMENNYEVVYGKRIKREGVNVIKKIAYSSFYRLLSILSNVEIPEDTGDFRLITKNVVDILRGLPERHRFVRGLIPYLGFTSYAFEYERKGRYAGDAKYDLRKLFNLAFTGIISFSSLPLRLASYLGLITIILTIPYALYITYYKFIADSYVSGVAGLSLAVIFFAGVQLLILGIIGEYLAKIFEEIKSRPIYLIKNSYNIASPTLSQFPQSRSMVNQNMGSNTL